MQKHILSCVLGAVLLAGCAGEMARREGVNMILDGQVDQGLAKLEEAVRKDPKNPDLRQEWLRQREGVVRRLLNQAQSARVQGDFAGAVGHYMHVLQLDSGNVMAANGIKEIDADRRQAGWMEDAQQRFNKGDIDGAKTLLRSILVERPNDPRANLLRQKIEEIDLPERLAGPKLNIQGRRPVTLQFRDANLKMVLDAIAKATGVNVLLDKDVKSDIKITIFVKDSPIEETLDLILLQSQLEKRVLGSNSILIYNATAAKQKEYQELKVRRFVLTNAEAKTVQQMLKTVLHVKDMHVDEKTNTIIMRESDAVIRLAEKLIASVDLPEAEVMLEVQLLDLDRNKTLQLGIDWPTAVTWAYPLGSAGKTLVEMKNVAKNWSSNAVFTNATSSIGASLKALQKDGDTRVLATPSIRTRSKEKARIMVGRRDPVVSTAAMPIAAGGASAGVAYNQNIQYLDTGIKLEVEPTVYADGEVSIKINLEVSELGERITAGVGEGTVIYPTTTNNATTTLRLKDGETQVLAGLIRAYSSNSGSNKVPGAGDVPLLGRLFGQQSDSWQNRELVLAITPRIVRNISAADAEVVEMWSGTESAVRFDAFHKGPAKLNRALSAPPPSAAPASRDEAAPEAPAAPAANEAAPAAPQAAAAPDSLGVVMPRLVGPETAKVGDVVTVNVDIPGASNSIGTMTFALKYDKERLVPVRLSEGNLVPESAKAGFKSQIDTNGGAMVGMLNLDAGNSISGAGTLAKAEFQVISPGKASISAINFSAMSPERRPVLLGRPWPMQLEISQ